MADILPIKNKRPALAASTRSVAGMPIPNILDWPNTLVLQGPRHALFTLTAPFRVQRVPRQTASSRPGFAAKQSDQTEPEADA